VDITQVFNGDVAGCNKQGHACLLSFTVYGAFANVLFTRATTCQGDIVHFRKYDYSAVQSVLAFLKNPHHVRPTESSCPCVLLQSSAVLPSVTLLARWCNPVLALFSCSESNAVGKELKTKKEGHGLPISAVELTTMTADHYLLMLSSIIIIPIHSVYTLKLCEYEFGLSFWNVRGSFKCETHCIVVQLSNTSNLQRGLLHLQMHNLPQLHKIVFFCLTCKCAYVSVCLCACVSAKGNVRLNRQLKA